MLASQKHSSEQGSPLEHLGNTGSGWCENIRGVLERRDPTVSSEDAAVPWQWSSATKCACKPKLPADVGDLLDETSGMKIKQS